MMSGESLTSELEYLCVEEFLSTFTGAQAIAAALELRVIDELAAHESASFDSLGSSCALDGQGLHLLLGLLRGAGVIEDSGVAFVRLTPAFRRALKFRDLIEAKIEFLRIAATDLNDHLATLIRNPVEFTRRTEMFRLFSYGHAYDLTEVNVARTQRWMRITTALTRYESAVVMRYYDFGKHRRWMDVGGNSGEFALRITRLNPHLHATVFDLPVVCDTGRRHIESESERERIIFVSGDALHQQLPRGADLITFKSMLHDWPETETSLLLNRAFESLEPGGTLLIFERGLIEWDSAPLPFSMCPMIPFAHCYRPSMFYMERLERLGFVNIRVTRINLEMPFHLIAAEKTLLGSFSEVRWSGQEPALRELRPCLSGRNEDLFNPCRSISIQAGSLSSSMLV